jgi:RHS repeat-associated protein
MVSNAYNDRLQPILLSAGITGQSPIFSECFDFHLGVSVTGPSPCSFSANTTGDNGNVYQIVNNRDNTRSQNFIYDSLNRIQQAYSSGTQWGETFGPTATSPGVPPATSGIDPWGNLTNRSGVTGKSSYESLSASAGTNNQLSGFGYDPAGNMTSNGSASYVYDDENRLIATAGYSYLYDGDGQRVEKCTEGTTPGTCATSAIGTLYWRGLGSAPLAETDLSGNVQNNYIFFNGQRVARNDSSGVIHYYFSDHLGSHGVVENATGTVCEQDIDYYPYGGQENDYCPDVSQNYKFTGKERDAESGLDMFGARYYGSSLGRFMTPDWATKPVAVPYAHYGNPQSLNLYSYVQNNPTTVGDPDGHCPSDDACSKVNVTVKVDSPPHVMENVKVGNNNVSGVGTTTTIKLTDSKGPMAGVAVKESPTTKDDLTGKTVSGSKSNPEPVTTSSQGQIGDVVMRGLASGSEPQSKQDTSDMKDYAAGSPYSHTTDQTLTFSSGGQTCQCTYSETLSNVDSKGNLNTQNNSQGTNYNLTTTTPVVKQKDPQSQ